MQSFETRKGEANLGERDVEVDEVTVPSPDFPDGQRFGPVTVESGRDDPFDTQSELPVAFAIQHRRLFGIDWYPGVCHARGIFNVTRNRIRLRLTTPVVVDRAAWWRRLGYWVLARPARTTAVTPALGRSSRR